MDITVTKLKDLIPYLEDGTRICIRCRYQDKDYQDFYGMDILKLSREIIDTLIIENIGVRLDMFPDGITPTLVISVSDKSEIITIDPSAMAVALGGVPDEVDVSFHAPYAEKSDPLQKSDENRRSIVDRINRVINSLLQQDVYYDEDEMDEDD